MASTTMNRYEISYAHLHELLIFLWFTVFSMPNLLGVCWSTAVNFLQVVGFSDCQLRAENQLLSIKKVSLQDFSFLRLHLQLPIHLCLLEGTFNCLNQGNVMGMYRSCRRGSQIPLVQGRRQQNGAILNKATLWVKPLDVHLWVVQMAMGHSGLIEATRNCFIQPSTNVFSQVTLEIQASGVGLVLRALLVTQWGSSMVSLLLMTRGLSVVEYGLGSLKVGYMDILLFLWCFVAKKFVASDSVTSNLLWFYVDICSAALSSSVGSIRMGSSPYGMSPMSSFTPGCSPPVGSAPKSFPHFQHPSHALLEDNGFKQQKYAPVNWFSPLAA